MLALRELEDVFGIGVGLVSGINFEDIISQLQAVGKKPIFNLQNKQFGFQQQQEALKSVNLRLKNILEQVDILNDPDSFRRRMVNVSDKDVLSAAAKANAAEGTYEVDVKQLAVGSRKASQGFIDSDLATVTDVDTEFKFKLGEDGTLKTIDVAAGTTLTELRDLINYAEEGIRASIVNDGSPTNPYRLILSSKNVGSDNQIIINPADNGTNLDFNTSIIEDAFADSNNIFNGTVTSSGTYTGTSTANVVVEVTTAGAIGAAQFRVSTDGGLTFGPDNEFTTSGTPVDIGDGIEISFSPDAVPVDFVAGDRFTIDAFNPNLQDAKDSITTVDGIQVVRDSNTVVDVIDGVTLSLSEVSESPVSITINNDTQNLVGPITSFVQAYNTMMEEINGLTNYDTESNVAGPLFGDSTVRGLRNVLQTTITSGLGTNLTSGFSNLTQIGIKTSTSGTLILDAAKLNDALSDNFEDVVNLFSASGNSSSTEVSFLTATEAARAGRYNINVTQVAEQANVSSGQAIDAGGITNLETLTFTLNEEEFAISLQGGMTIDQIIEQLNERFSEEGVDLSAVEDSAAPGILKIHTTQYGSAAKFSVVSDQNGGVSSQLGIGTAKQDLQGQNVLGLINGYAATGEGQTLTGFDDDPAEGVSFTITSTTTGNKGIVDVRLGVAHSLGTIIKGYNDSTDGLIKSRIDGLDDSVEDINSQIESIQNRLTREAESLRKQFIGLETIIAQSQSQSAFLSQQLAQLSSIRINKS